MEPAPAPAAQTLPGTTLPQDPALLIVGAPMADAASPPGPASAEGQAPAVYDTAAYMAPDIVAAPLPASGSADLDGDVGPHDPKSHKTSPTDEAPQRAVPEMFQGATPKTPGSAPKSAGPAGPFGSRAPRKPPSHAAFAAKAPALGPAEVDAQARDDPLPPPEEEPASASAVDASYAALPVPPAPPAAPAADDGAAAAPSAPLGSDGVRQWNWDGWDANVDHPRMDSNGNIDGYWVHRTRFNTDSTTIWHFVSIDIYNAMFRDQANTNKGGKYGKGHKSKATARPNEPYHGTGKGSRPARDRQPQWPDRHRAPGAPRPPPVWDTPAPPPAPKSRPNERDNQGWRGGWNQRDDNRWW